MQRATTPPRPGAGPPDDAALFSLELAERLGLWSLRWQEAQDNAAKSLAGRYLALSDHLGRMSSLEEGRSVREAVKPAGRPVESKPPRSFAEIARFFRPVDERGVDRAIPELVDFERPLNPRGIAVTPAERVEIASRVYQAILDEAGGRFLASPRQGGHQDEGAIFDARLAERLGDWSDCWRQAQDAADMDLDSRSAAARNGSVRLALAGARLAEQDSRLATVQSHVERMRALESGRFLYDTLKRAGRPVVEPVDMNRLREFVDVVRFFRIEAERQLPNASRPKRTDVMASSRAAARIYHAILDSAARQYQEMPRTGGAPADASLVFDPCLAERLGSWSISWRMARPAWARERSHRSPRSGAHLERMASLEDGRSLRDALARAGAPTGKSPVPASPREFTQVARFFRLEALWELAMIRSR